MELTKGTLLQGGKFRIVAKLGQGGFGITYKAFQEGLGRYVAIKEFYLKDISVREGADNSRVTLCSSKSYECWSKFKAKFIKEAKTIAILDNPGVIKVIDVFEENHTAYYAMEYISGCSLKSYVENHGSLSEDKAISIIEKVGNALEYIHSKNILHLDIKPDNIMMKDGETPVIIDFGISKRYDETGGQTSMMQTGRSMGYAPVEQYQHGGLASFCPATDVYSLAATLYFVLAGSRPPESISIYESELPVIPDVSVETMTAIKKGMSPRKADRPQTVAAFLSLFDLGKRPELNTADVSHHRNVIETMMEGKNYKDAYNFCLENISVGNDVEYSKKIAAEAVRKMRRRNGIENFFTVFVVIIIVIGGIILTISLQ